MNENLYPLIPPHKLTINETLRFFMSVYDEKDMSDDKKHLLKMKSMQNQAKHLSKRWTMTDDGALFGG